VEQFFHSVPGYLLNVFLSTINQVVILLGPLLILAMIMHFVSTVNQNLGYRLMGSRLFLNVFGWLGTAIHELGHAFFALLFLHKITEMKLFSPDTKKGSLGYVSHTWNSSNPYQTIGNFFIGIGPILMGTCMLYLITYLLFFTSSTRIALIPITSDSFSGFASIKNILSSTGQGFMSYLIFIFDGPNSSWWKIILFLYLTFSIGSSITLSIEDIKGALKGFMIFVLLLVLFNLLTIWAGDFTVEFFRYISSFFSAFYFLLIISILLNLSFILILLILVGIRSWIMKRVNSEQ
jgi:hypothetical protein